MKRLGIGLLCAFGGYFVGAFSGYFLIKWFSSNVHDRSLEAAMSSIFVWGPVGAVVAFVIGLIWGGRGSRSAGAINGEPLEDVTAAGKQK